jgi:glucose-6-phosphate dehydrogenase assembly protein OpcA
MPARQSLKRSQSVDAFLSGKLAQVDVRKIEDELRRLWTKASDAGDGDQYPQVVKACTSNLILYTEREDAETTEANTLDEIVVTHPARAILAIRRPGQTQRLAAWVTARCRLASGPGPKQICSEQITVLAEGNLELELVSVVDSLLIGDLPVYLWWSDGDLCGDKLGPFLSCTRRLIVDSRFAPYSFEFLRCLHRIVDSTAGCIAVSDLNWRRLSGIRAALAEEFEHSPLALGDLKNIVRVKVSSCAQESDGDTCSLQSLLLVGWLSARLGWDPISFAQEKAKGALACFDQNGSKIEVEFSSVEMPRAMPGSVVDFEIELSSKRKLSVSRDPSGESASLVVNFNEDNRLVREVLADESEQERVRLIGLELDEVGFDPVFEQALESAFNLVHLLEED